MATESKLVPFCGVETCGGGRRGGGGAVVLKASGVCIALYGRWGSRCWD